MTETQLQQSKSENTKSGLFRVLASTRNAISATLSGILSASAKIDESDLEQIYDALILSDIGIDASDEIVQSVKKSLKRSPLSASQITELFKQELASILAPAQQSLRIEQYSLPAIIMMIGVNGVGKTTTIAKIAHHFQKNNLSVMLAACDTYRPAAIEQLQNWGNRLNVPVIAQNVGSDPAAVAHDAVHAAIARTASVLLLDTAGRQQSRDDLMRQLNKIHRVVAKIEPSAPHETLITIDAGTGQNALSQVEHFNSHCPISGICLTKLDGTAKGGIVVPLTQKHSLPIPFVGLGEKIDDIAPFQVQQYVDSLFDVE